MPQPMIPNKSLRITCSNSNYNCDAHKGTLFVHFIRVIVNIASASGYIGLLEKNNFVRTTYYNETISYEKDT